MAYVLVVGDDLTGTNATAAMYARNGLRAVTVLGTGDLLNLHPDDIQVIACSTDSRHMDPTDAARKVAQVITRFGSDDQVLVKRFDTTLRGNIGAEIEATLVTARRMRPGQRMAGLVVPAFPAAGRATIGGYQTLDGAPILMGPAASDPFTPVRHSRVADTITEQAGLTIAEVGLDLVMGDRQDLRDELARCATRADLVVVDSITEAHQARIAEAAASLVSDEFDWVIFDTGPFGATYAASVGLESEHSTNPILVLLGSTTDRTRIQANRLEEDSTVRLVTVSGPDVDLEQVCEEIEANVASGCSVVGIRTVGRQPEFSDPSQAAGMLDLIVGVARHCATTLDLGGIYASGGDVCIAVLAGLEAQGYAIETEVLPLAVCGALVGGPYDGLGFATKGGLVGEEDAAEQCVNQLRERGRRPRTVYVTADSPSTPPRSSRIHVTETKEK